MSRQTSVEIVAVSSRRERKQFLEFPWTLYRGDPNWVPPLRLNQKELLNYRRHPFYNDAVVQTFLARRDGQVCGRVAAIIDHAHNRYYNEQRGMFGFFECVDDRTVSDALFDACRQWFADRGIRLMRGPLNPSQNYECGLLIEGFDSPPSFMMSYNHPWYPALIEGYGFRKAQDLFAYYGHADMLDSLDPKMHFVAGEAMKRFNLKLRSLDRRHFIRDVTTFMRLYNESLPGQWGFVPLSEAELRHIAAGLRFLIIPELTTIAEDESGPVGVVFGLLDYNPIIRRIDGRLFPFGFIRLLRDRKRLKRVRLLSTNIQPRYQRWGLALVMMSRIIPEAVGYGLEECEFSWVLESNNLSRGTLERGGAIRSKTYRIYDWETPDT